MKISGKALICALAYLGAGFLTGRNFCSHPANKAGDEQGPEAFTPRNRSASSNSEIHKASPKLGDARPIEALTPQDAIDQLKRLRNRETPLAKARSDYEDQLLIDSLPLTTLESVAKILATDPKAKDGLGKIAFRAWAIRDWKKALAWADASPESQRWISSALEGLLASDPDSAANAVADRMANGRLSLCSNSDYDIAQKVARAMAKEGKEALLGFLESLRNEDKVNLLAATAEALPATDLHPLADELYQKSVSDGSNVMLKQVVEEMVRRNPAAARHWLETVPTEKDCVVLTMDAATQMAYLNQLPQAKELFQYAIEHFPGQEKQFFKRLIAPGLSNSELLPEIAATLPAHIELTAEDYALEQQGFFWSFGPRFVNLAKTIRDPEQKVEFLKRTLDLATEKYTAGGERSGPFDQVDFEAFQRSLNTLNLDQAATEKINRAVARTRDAALLSSDSTN